MAGEKKFELKVRSFLESVGVYEAGTPKQDMKTDIHGWFFKHWGGGFSKSGIPDLICNVNGFFISAELKASNGRSSDLQKRNTIIINKGNGLGMILYPEGLEEFKNLIRGCIGCNSHIPGLEALKAANSSSKCIILME
jgi:hypothetical protein